MAGIETVRTRRFAFSLGVATGALLLLYVAAMLAAAAPAADAAPASDSYIVVLKDDVAHPANVAERHEENRNADVEHIYRIAIKGYSADLSPGELEAVKQDPNVDYVERDRVRYATSQSPSFAIPRVGANTNPKLDIDEKEDAPIDADIAIIDSGVAPHVDLNIAGRTNCVSTGGSCVDGAGIPTVDGHGTHVAGIAAARDNTQGVVGGAPGARIWSVRVLNNKGEGDESDIIAGIEWVTARSSTIEVANMSLGGVGPVPNAETDAIAASINQGVVYTIAAGNESTNAAQYSPAALPEAITVSAITDYNGVPGGQGSNWCPEEEAGLDDWRAAYSNFGAVIDIAAPGSCIRSTWFSNQYKWDISGTSMAAPLVAGAAAVLASQSNPENAADVEAIRNALRSQGSNKWHDDSGDGIHEPLLDMSSAAVFSPRYSPPPPLPSPTVTTDAPSEVYSTTAKLNGSVYPNGSSTNYYFQYGTTTAYGNTIPVSPGMNIGNGWGYVYTWNNVSGLQSGTTYHYRNVATNAGGTSYGADRTFTTAPQVGMIANGAAYVQNYPYAANGWSVIDSNGDTQMQLSGSMATVIRGNYSYYQNKPFSCCGWAAFDTFDTRLSVTRQASGASLFAAIRTDKNAYVQSTPLTCCGWSIIDNNDTQVSMTSPTTGGSYVGVIRGGNAYIQHTPLSCCGWSIVDNNDVQMAMASSDSGGSAMAVIRNTNGNGTGDTYVQTAPYSCCGWQIVDNNDRQVAMARGADGKIRIGVVRTDGSAWVQSAPFSCCGWVKVANASMNVQRLVMSGDTLAILRGIPASGNSIVSYQRAPFSTSGWQDIGSGATQVVLQGGSPADGGDASSPAPPDHDGDLVPDTDDKCLMVAGSYTKQGC